MAQNIQTVNDVATHPSALLQTCNRPVIIQFEDASSAPVPSMVQIDLSVEKGGIWTQVGTTQVSSRDWDSSVTTPKFTFDISSLLSAHIGSGFYESIFTIDTDSPASMTNTSGNTGFNSIIQYKLSARAWYVDSATSILTLNDTDAAVICPSSSTRYVANIAVRDSELTTTKYSNMNVDTAWNVDGAGAQVTTSMMLTNCPKSLRRKVELDMPLSVSVLGRGNSSSINLRQQFTKDDGALLTGTLVVGVVAASTTDIKTVNVTPNDTYLMSTWSGGSAAACGKNFEMYLNSTSGDSSHKLKFELYNNSSTTNPNLSKLKPEACAIYFVNDYNTLDYFLFDSFLDVTHNHETVGFKRGYKDYTSRASSKRGVARGKTEEIYTCSTLVNRETSEWLSEIYRSREVYLYDRVNKEFIPISVINEATRPSYANRSEAQSFTLSFVKDSYVIKG